MQKKEIEIEHHWEITLLRRGGCQKPFLHIFKDKKMLISIFQHWRSHSSAGFTTNIQEVTLFEPFLSFHHSTINVYLVGIIAVCLYIIWTHVRFPCYMNTCTTSLIYESKGFLNMNTCMTSYHMNTYIRHPCYMNTCMTSYISVCCRTLTLSSFGVIGNISKV